MNDIRPFSGLRFDERIVGPLGAVVCPPYDVISPPEQVRLHARSPHNAIRLELGTEFPGDDASNNRYSRAADTLRRWVEAGVVRREREPALYLYEHRFLHQGRSLAVRGLLARLRLSPWEDGVVLPHEDTMPLPKADRLSLMRATQANLSPLMLLFDDPSGMVRELMGEAMAQGNDAFTADPDDGHLHQVFTVRGSRQERILRALREPQLYMADGHHRYETALAYARDVASAAAANASGHNGSHSDVSRVAATGSSLAERGNGRRNGLHPPHEFAMVLLVDSREPDLLVLPTHRLIRGIDGERLAALGRSISAMFEVEEVEKGPGPGATADRLLERLAERGREGHALGVYGRGSLGAAVLKLRTRAETRANGARPVLDVDVLHDMVLAPAGMGSGQSGPDGEVAYLRDAAEALKAVDRGDAQMAFLLNATRVEQVLATARARGRMPQKSTFFFPKPATGLVFHSLAIGS